MFFAEWLGGPRRYSEVAWTDLKHSHDGKPITQALARRWLGHFKRGLQAAVAAEQRTQLIVLLDPLIQEVNQPVDRRLTTDTFEQIGVAEGPESRGVVQE